MRRSYKACIVECFAMFGAGRVLIEQQTTPIRDKPAVADALLTAANKILHPARRRDLRLAGRGAIVPA
jgi:hypothetical protein